MAEGEEVEVEEDLAVERKCDIVSPQRWFFREGLGIRIAWGQQNGGVVGRELGSGVEEEEEEEDFLDGVVSDMLI